MDEILKINSNTHKCVCCGLGIIEQEYYVCSVCGWEDDPLQNKNPSYIGGANQMSLNQYKEFWSDCKEQIIPYSGDKMLYIVKLADEYYQQHFKLQDDKFNTNIDAYFDNNQKHLKEKQFKIKENVLTTDDGEESEYIQEKRLKKHLIVRNGFKTAGKYGMPVIKKQNIDLDKISLWNYVKTKPNDSENKDKTIHFFTYDWNFENVYEKPNLALEKLDQYYALLTPEFSMYWDMPKALQINSTFKNRWCGAYWQKMGKLVIPTICCAGEDSYDFCFDGIEEGSIVAISTYRREKYKKEILKSYNKMLEVIKPSAVICYGTPFSEMKGKIKVIDPYNKEELIKKIGLEEFTKRYLEGSLYPEI